MTSKETIRTTSQPTGILVWDPLVRFGHWALVAAFAVAYFSAAEGASGPGVWHVWSGYLVGSIVVLRVVWGFVGPRHARFSDFVYGPLKTLVYLRDLLLLGGTRRYLGHSPAGGAMVIALLICLAATVATGVVAYGESGKGPWQRRWRLTPSMRAGMKPTASVRRREESDRKASSAKCMTYSRTSPWCSWSCTS